MAICTMGNYIYNIGEIESNGLCNVKVKDEKKQERKQLQNFTVDVTKSSVSSVL